MVSFFIIIRIAIGKQIYDVFTAHLNADFEFLPKDVKIC